MQLYQTSIPALQDTTHQALLAEGLIKIIPLQK